MVVCVPPNSGVDVHDVVQMCCAWWCGCAWYGGVGASYVVSQVYISGVGVFCVSTLAGSDASISRDACRLRMRSCTWCLSKRALLESNSVRK